MTLKAIASYFWGSDPTKCFAGCHKPPYQDLIVTKCDHIFCKACLEGWLKSPSSKEKPQPNKSCPGCRETLSDMRPSNIGVKDSDGDKEYTSFKLYLERFTYYLENDFETLQEKLIIEKVFKVASCRLKKEAKLTSPRKAENVVNDECPICYDMPFQMYFIVKDDNNPARVGRHFHEDCWQTAVDDDCEMLDIAVHDLVKVAKALTPLDQLPPKPVKPISAIKVFFLVTIVPVSAWALAMNSRLYHNRNVFFFVLSIPALVVFKILSLVYYGIKAIFKDKPA